MKKPWTITQRLEDQSPKLLHEVVTELKILKGIRLSIRVLERKQFIYDLLELSPDEQTLKIILSPYAQIQFLEEHLHRHEIMNVLLSVEPDTPLLDRYITLATIPKQTDPYFEEMGLTVEYMNMVNRDISSEQLCTNLMSKIDALVTKVISQKEIINLFQTDLPYMTTYQIAWWCELLADDILHTELENKINISAETYLQSYTNLKKSGYVIWTHDIHLLLQAAAMHRQDNNLDEAENIYCSVMEQSYHIKEKANDWYDDPEDGDLATVYGKRRYNKAHTLRHDAQNKLLFSSIYYVQVLIERLQATEQMNDDLSQQIWHELSAFYTFLKEKKYIKKNMVSPYEISNIRRFVYARYMFVIGEDTLAYEELNLINQKNISDDLAEVVNILQENKSFTYVKNKQSNSPEKQSTSPLYIASKAQHKNM
jgi:hypothetical protein